MIANKYVFNTNDYEFDIRAGSKPSLKIPENRYDVLVPSEALLHPDEFRWKMSVNGEEYKNQKYTSYTHCVLNIEQMLEIFEEGYKISLVNVDDAAKIYFNIQNFLKRIEGLYRDELEDLFKIDDRIMMLDKFASSIYKNNAMTLSKNTIESFTPLKALSLFESNFIIEDRKSISQQQYEEIFEPNNQMPFNKYVSEVLEEQNELHKVKPFEHYKEPKIEFENLKRESVYDNIEKIRAQRESIKLNNSTLVNKDNYGKFI